MKINANRLNERMNAIGATPEQLAPAVARPGLKQADAERAIRNWMAGRHQPTAKARDIATLAAQLGCDLKDISRFVTKSCFQRSSWRKARLLADMIRGMSVVDAETALAFNKRRGAVFVLKTLKAATDQAEHAGADATALIVSESRVDEGPIIKRFHPKDRGRAHPIWKRTSHIIIGVEEAA